MKFIIPHYMQISQVELPLDQKDSANRSFAD